MQIDTESEDVSLSCFKQEKKVCLPLKGKEWTGLICLGASPLYRQILENVVAKRRRAQLQIGTTTIQDLSSCSDTTGLESDIILQ